jgi:hypothetical protein
MLVWCLRYRQDRGQEVSESSPTGSQLLSL